MRDPDMGEGALYEIEVAGCLHDDWSAWFESQIVKSERENKTTIVADLPDQAALYGLLAKVRDLGMTLLSVNRRIE